MSGAGAPSPVVVDAAGLRVGVVVSSWHAEVTDALLAGALRATSRAGAGEPTVLRVPGAFELPIGAQSLARDHDAVVALGVVVRGGTPHFDYVCAAATQGLLRVGLDSGVPVGFGLLPATPSSRRSTARACRAPARTRATRPRPRRWRPRASCAPGTRRLSAP